MKETVHFTKMQGAGNDYIYVDTQLYDIPNPEKAAIAWSAYHTGIGSDGLVLIGKPQDGRRADYSMRIFNADGSEAMMCGNASRCIGKYLYEKGLTRKETIRLETLSGIKILKLHLQDNKKVVDSGAKSDTGNIQEILRWDNNIGVTDPIYPVYIDSNVMIGRAGVFENGKWSNVTYMPCDESDDFIPQIPDHRVDMIYLCYPNNPTGTVISKEELRKWVNYAIRNESIILYDAAYEAYITDPEIPHSIYEIRGARKVAIEFHSYSKTAGFTGVRCGYTIVPKELKAKTLAGEEVALNPIWDRRQCTKFNGTSYISQRAAEAIYTPEGKEQVKATINYYMENAHFMRAELQKLGLKVYGGENAPYIWVKTPNNTPSWKFFEEMLYGASVVCTPGVGFGPSGEGYIRLTAFGEHEDCKEAMERIAKWLGK